MNLFSPTLGQTPPRVYTVAALTAAIRGLLERELGLVWVQGEVSGLRQPGSGHVYFILKDEAAQLKAVIFKTARRQIAFQPEEGLQVLAFGRLTVYEPRGEYQLLVDHLEPLGAGALALAFEQLKKKLAAEGLFDQARKRPLPLLPRRVGLITSLTGAAMWDFLRILHRRHPGLTVQVYPVQVQGDRAPGQIAQALADLNRLVPAPEVLVLARGGGSLEDLWAFNTETVARAVAGSAIPVVSAVGHEVDFTIADFVADLRASTPSAAAELLIRPKAEWLAEIDGWRKRLTSGLADRLAQERFNLAGLADRLGDPRRLLDRRRLRLAEAQERLTRSWELPRRQWWSRLGALAGRLQASHPRHRLALLAARLAGVDQALAWRTKIRLDQGRGRVASLAERLEALSPLAVLARGYSLTQKVDGRVVRSAEQVRQGEMVQVRLAQGRLGCRVEEVEP